MSELCHILEGFISYNDCVLPSGDDTVLSCTPYYRVTALLCVSSRYSRLRPVH